MSTARCTTATQPLTYTIAHGNLDLLAQGIATTYLRLAFGDAAAQRWAITDAQSGAASMSSSSSQIADVALLATQVPSRLYLPLLQLSR